MIDLTKSTVWLSIQFNKQTRQHKHTHTHTVYTLSRVDCNVQDANELPLQLNETQQIQKVVTCSHAAKKKRTCINKISLTWCYFASTRNSFVLDTLFKRILNAFLLFHPSVWVVLVFVQSFIRLFACVIFFVCIAIIRLKFIAYLCISSSSAMCTNKKIPSLFVEKATIAVVASVAAAVDINVIKIWKRNKKIVVIKTRANIHTNKNEWLWLERISVCFICLSLSLPHSLPSAHRLSLHLYVSNLISQSIYRCNQNTFHIKNKIDNNRRIEEKKNAHKKFMECNRIKCSIRMHYECVCLCKLCTQH